MPPSAARRGPGRILAAAQDAGGCNAIVPVLKKLKDLGVAMQVVADGPAHTIFTAEALSVRRLTVEEASVTAGPLFDSWEPNLLVVGNSHGPSLEDCFVQEARRRNVASVGVLDSWLLYDQKFTDGTDRWAYLPDMLIVMDEIAKEEMTRLGAPPERLLPLGQPHFDQLHVRAGSLGETQRRALRASLGATNEDRLVLFLSQDMKRFYGGARKALETIGYTEYLVLDLLKHNLDRLAKRRDQGIRLAVKLHPRETASKYQTSGLRVVRDGDAHLLMLSSDLVVGMDTILLVEAGLLGCTTLSLQPCRKGIDSLITNRLGFGQFCYSPEEVEGKLEALLFDEESRGAAVRGMQQFSVLPCATERVTGWIVNRLEEMAH